MTRWTVSDVEKLTALYQASGPVLDLDALAAQMGRSRMAVANKANELGLSNKYRPRSGPAKSRRKYETEAERKAGQSKAQKEWYKNNPHPRGALGMKHTPEARQKMAAALQGLTHEQRSAMGHKAALTKVERYGSGRSYSGNPYSNARRGKRDDLGDIFFRSRWEANYARYLNWLKAQGQIYDWKFEPKTFVFHGVTRGAITYLPDFQVFDTATTYAWHEVKGWMKSKDRTKLKRMAKYYPDEKVILISQPEYREIENTLAGLIPNWEYKDDKEWAGW